MLRKRRTQWTLISDLHNYSEEQFKNVRITHEPSVLSPVCACIRSHMIACTAIIPAVNAAALCNALIISARSTHFLQLVNERFNLNLIICARSPPSRLNPGESDAHASVTL